MLVVLESSAKQNLGCQTDSQGLIWYTIQEPLTLPTRVVDKCCNQEDKLFASMNISGTLADLDLTGDNSAPALQRLMSNSSGHLRGHLRAGSHCTIGHHTNTSQK